MKSISVTLHLKAFSNYNIISLENLRVLCNYFITPYCRYIYVAWYGLTSSSWELPEPPDNTGSVFQGQGETQVL